MKILKVCFILAMLALSVSSVLAKQFYRFKNADGNLVVKDQLTNEMIEVGYDVISDTGSVLNRVGPGKTLAEEDQVRLDKIEARKAEFAFKLKIRSDAELLRQFASIGDIIRNRDAQLLALEQRIRIQGSKSDLLKLQLESQQNQAATHERLGQAVPKLIQNDIQATLEQIQNSLQTVKNLEVEKIDVAARFEGDIVRYKELETLRRTIKKDSLHNDGSKPIVYDCPDLNICQRAWQLAQVYAKDNASGQIEIITNSLILTSRPEKDTDLALSFSRIPAPNNENQIIFEISCMDSELGAELCKSDIVKRMRSGYLTQVNSRAK